MLCITSIGFPVKREANKNRRATEMKTMCCCPWRWIQRGLWREGFVHEIFDPEQMTNVYDRRPVTSLHHNWQRQCDDEDWTGERLENGEYGNDKQPCGSARLSQRMGDLFQRLYMTEWIRDAVTINPSYFTVLCPHPGSAVCYLLVSLP